MSYARFAHIDAATRDERNKAWGELAKKPSSGFPEEYCTCLSSVGNCPCCGKLKRPYVEPERLK